MSRDSVVEKSDRKNTTFMRRFNQLRGDRSQAAFGKLLGLSAATIGFYENGNRLPNAADLLRIATVCGVSTDWLLGLSEVKSPDATLRRLSSLLYDPLIIPDNNSKNALRPVKGTTRKEIYGKLLKAQFVLGVPSRWYPEQWRGAQEADNFISRQEAVDYR